MLNIVAFVEETLSYHLNLNGVLSHADSTQSRGNMNLLKYNEKENLVID